MFKEVERSFADGKDDNLVQLLTNPRIDAAGLIESFLVRQLEPDYVGPRLTQAQAEKVIKAGLHHWSWWVRQHYLLLASSYRVQLTPAELNPMQQDMDHAEHLCRLFEDYLLNHPQLSQVKARQIRQLLNKCYDFTKPKFALNRYRQTMEISDRVPTSLAI